MTADDKLTRLSALLRGYFLEARRQHQEQRVEKRGSETKPEAQIPHPYDHMIDVICQDLNLPNPGTDGHSLVTRRHPLDGFPADYEERLRRCRVRFAMEKGRDGDDAWLRPLGLKLTTKKWVTWLDDYDTDKTDDGRWL